MLALRYRIKKILNRLQNFWGYERNPIFSREKQPDDLQNQQLGVERQIYEIVRNSGHFEVSDSEIVTKIFTGLKIYLDPRDISLTPHLVLDGIWEGNISNAWLSVIRHGDTIFDIGANFGYYGALAAQKTNKKESKVVFFEANPALIPYIRKTLGVNWLNEQSVIENLAVSDKSQIIKLNVLEDYIGSSSALPLNQIRSFMGNKMYLKTAETINVKSVTLDDYCKKFNINSVDLIKMDIEGYEQRAYRGMAQVIKSSPELTLFLEFTKEAYKNPEIFYNQIIGDFNYVYQIDDVGRLHKVSDKSYAAVIGTTDDWVMPVFSKRGDLDEINTHD